MKIAMVVGGFSIVPIGAGVWCLTQLSALPSAMRMGVALDALALIILGGVFIWRGTALWKA